MAQESSKIICGDSAEKLPKLKGESVDLLLTDPPYGTNDEYGKNIRRGQDDTAFGTIGWDVEMPLEYLRECHRILKDDRWGVVFTDRKEITTVWRYLEEVGFRPRNTFYWIKTNKAPTPRSNFKSSVETAVVFTKGKTTEKWRGGGDQDNYYESPFVSGGEKRNHPTQKPLKLFERLVTLFTDEEDVVLDPFVGSGTAAKAAERRGRICIGIEKEPEYAEMARDRMKKAETKRSNLDRWT
jgi:DNA modification methylase